MKLPPIVPWTGEFWSVFARELQDHCSGISQCNLK